MYFLIEKINDFRGGLTDISAKKSSLLPTCTSHHATSCIELLFFIEFVSWSRSKTPTGDLYYFNFATGDSTWDHPCDTIFKCVLFAVHTCIHFQVQ